MICRQCRSSLLSRLPSSRLSSSSYANLASRQHLLSQSRFYSSAPPTAETKATSPSPAGAPSKARPKVVSATPAGTKLEGLNYEKNKQDPIAMEDHEYPDWLWTLLDSPGKKAAAGSVDVASMNKKARKKHDKKMAALAAGKPRPIPAHEQATDITPASYNIDPSAGEAQAADNIEAATSGLAVREEITKSARNARKKAIKESNFLRGL
ncbi:uncharacterized protein GIQ15_04709 [Arthroderma uncinatum]|uniref:uncharacterized protein n=1 Tax=Arthroderma uncinatum TaxID=74035 RepID=UPI00144AC24C|nr:uncharacterized protein GIQ15_04709 [Arthroderma uncinatum]KAF3481950.1 hypothetical protein GIQ15_04709 [Arthroderma uncinatum]